MLQKKYNVQQFADSHSSDWDIQVKKLYPKVVDLVLNSLSGNNIAMGINVLCSSGTFIEIGKRDLMSSYAMNMNPFLNNLSYFSVYLDRLVDTHPAMLGSMLTEIAKLFDAKVFVPFVDKVFCNLSYSKIGLPCGKYTRSIQVHAIRKARWQNSYFIRHKQ